MEEADVHPSQGSMDLVVVGAHMTGLPLNHQLTDLHASFVKACKTAPVYRMYSLGPRPALIRQHEKDAGVAFAVEVWSMPLNKVGAFLLNGVKPPLCIGDVLLEDGTEVKGFLGEAYAVQGAEDVSAYGGWRAYVSSRS
eukprot:CAMPEP_0202343340 /NCGR_PEP_ID=MMETSP1126-20121109/3502_1 /ASSEMBLY_ACC=CAM_ASM_000457 /TAXON_ID=3047 /ORGANISM="Dunaliella tertiolecta, Strain CCMP1320" /LENGTH=138 /DNA_ID=CAMNT_0048934393 /DNA_START=107 /DNA_END=523 /DNA_ORIENTATION=-